MVVETRSDNTAADRVPAGLVAYSYYGAPAGIPVPAFGGDVVTDPTAGATDTLTISVGEVIYMGINRGIGGTITGEGLTKLDASTYTLTGSAQQVTASLEALLYVPSSISSSVLFPASTQLSFAIESDLAGTDPVYASTTALITEVPCYAAGTRIATERGEVLVEELQAGDVAILATGGTAPIVWMGHRRVRGADPVRVMAGAFGLGLPKRDLVLSPEHALFLDGHLVPASALVDGVSVIQEIRDSVTYYHVELDRHGVLLAEGLPAESYLDTGNRTSFANGALVSLHADFERGGEPAEACAPLALTGTVVEAQRAKLRAVALEQSRRVA